MNTYQTSVALLIGTLFMDVLILPAAARPLENRISQDPRSTSVEQLDLQILRYAAMYCGFPAPHDTLRVAIHYELPIRLSDAYDQWGQPFIYNEPAIYGSAQFDLYSVGPNGIDENGQGDDISNWQLRRDIASSWATRDDLEFWSRPYRTARLLMEEELASARAASDPVSGSKEADEKRSGSKSWVKELAQRMLMIDGPVILIAAMVWRRRFGLVLLTVATLTTSSFAVPIEPGAVYRYTESQVYYLKWSIIDFRASHCRYPASGDSFTMLADAGLDSLSSLGSARDYWGRPFVMRFPSTRDGELFDLYSVGRNGIDELGDGDDIGVDGTQQVFEEHYAPRPSPAARQEGRALARTSRHETKPSQHGRTDTMRPRDFALVGRWLGYVDAPLIVLFLLAVRWRRENDGAYD